MSAPRRVWFRRVWFRPVVSFNYLIFCLSVSVFNPFLCRARFRATHTALAP